VPPDDRHTIWRQRFNLRESKNFFLNSLGGGFCIHRYSQKLPILGQLGTLQGGGISFLMRDGVLASEFVTTADLRRIARALLRHANEIDGVEGLRGVRGGKS
jgi:hypothetical protein